MKLSVKIFLGVMSGILVFPLQGADKILDNGDFSKINQNGVPGGWIPVNNSKDYVSAKNENGDNYIALSCPSGKTAFLVHKDLTLEAGKKYIINYKVKSGTESAFMVYLEWVDKSKELKSLHQNSWVKVGSGSSPS